MEKTLSQQLAENLRYYVNGKTNRRCRNNDGCFYSGTSITENETEGCFVGRLLSPDDRIKADEYFKIYDDSSSVGELIDKQDLIGIKIPKIIIENKSLFSRLQSLHDSAYNWDWNGFTLNNLGKEELKFIINQFNLNEEDFAEFLIFNEG